MRIRHVFAVVALAVLASCGSPEDSADEPDGTQGPGAAPSSAFDLPLGLEQVDGTDAVAAPVVAEQTTLLYQGEPVRSLSVRAAYWVTGDPGSVLAGWAEQLGDLGVGEVGFGQTESGQQQPGMPEYPWAEVGAHHFTMDGPGPGSARVQLWSTTAAPLLLVEVDRHLGEDPVPGAVPDVPPLAPAPPGIPAGAVPPGGVLFTEQGAAIHLPADARAVTPTVPTMAGTGGNTVVLVTEDPEATARAMVQEGFDINEAAPQHEPGTITGPEVAELDGATTVTAGFNSGSGGWTMQAVASKDPEAELGTVWVSTAAD
jgi:hypothetical protein